MTDAALLQKSHRQVTDLFPPPGWRKEYELTTEQIELYHQLGYIQGGRVLDDRQLDALRLSLEKIRTGQNPRLGELYEIDEAWQTAPDQAVFHILGMWLIDEVFHDLLWHPAITVKASQLLGTPSVRFWHDQTFYKPPRHPGVVAWHQDYSYWTVAYPARHTTCNIVLDDVDLDNGCLQFVPGSHRWPLLPKLELLEDMEGVKTVLSPEQVVQFKPDPMLARASECTFHHSPTMHGSYGNPSDRPRRALALNFMHPETRCGDGTNPLLYGVPVIPEGEIIQGDYFPLVLD